MSRQTTTQADIQRAPTRSGGERARGGEDHAEAPLQLMVGPGVGTTALSALMAAGGNVQMAQLSQPVQRSANKDGAEGGGEDKLRLVIGVLENKLGRELKGADVKTVRDQLKGREAEPTPELVRDLLPMLGGEAPVQQRAAGAVQRQAGGGEDTGAVHAAAARGIAGGGGSLPYAEQIQQSFGRHDVSGIKGHVGGPAREASEAMGAEAYATGDHVAFKGQPTLHTAAHEAAHVVQQRAGVSLKGGVGQVGDAYERHADAVADRVVQGKSAEDLLDTMAGGGPAGAAPKRAVQHSPAKSGSVLFWDYITTGALSWSSGSFVRAPIPAAPVLEIGLKGSIGVSFKPKTKTATLTAGPTIRVGPKGLFSNFGAEASLETSVAVQVVSLKALAADDVRGDFRATLANTLSCKVNATAGEYNLDLVSKEWTIEGVVWEFFVQRVSGKWSVHTKAVTVRRPPWAEKMTRQAASARNQRASQKRRQVKMEQFLPLFNKQFGTNYRTHNQAMFDSGYRSMFQTFMSGGGRELPW